MEKIIRVGDYEIPLKSTAASLFSYKAQFGRDAMKDLLALVKTIPDGDVNAETLAESDFDMDLFYRFLWVFAKAADPSIPPLVEWLGVFDVGPFEFMETALPESMELLMGTTRTNVKSKNRPAARGIKK
jgi:hypothetical protein